MDEYDIQEAFAAIEEKLIKSMMRNMARHRVEEIAEEKEWSMWQAEQLKALEKYKKANQKAFQKEFSKINESISDVITQARQQGNMDQEIEILEAIKNGFKPTRALKAHIRTSAEFFRLNDRKIDALIKATKQDLQKAEVAMLRMANDQYRKIIFNAQVFANSGSATYEQAVDMASKDFLSAGINCIEYKNGARVNIASYASMALQTASKRAYFTGEGEKRQEWGITTVIMNKRGAACPKCLPFVGKILIDDVWSGGKASDGPYPLMSSAIAKGLYHPRCKDSHTTYFEGITTPPKQMTQADVDNAADKYRTEQKQKYNDCMAQKYKRVKENCLDKSNKETAKNKEEMWANKAAKSLPATSNNERHDAELFGDKFKKKASIKQEPVSDTFRQAQTLQEAKEYAFKELGVVYNGIDGVPLEVINSINNQYAGLLSDNPHMKGFIQNFDFNDMQEGVYAARRLTHEPDNRISRSIMFNKSEYKDINLLTKKYNSAVKAGMFPKGTHVDNILDHEFGHALADDMALKMKKLDINGKYDSEGWQQVRAGCEAFSKLRVEDAAKKMGITPLKLQGNISRYAKENYAETFAEAFSSSRGANPSKEALAVMKEYDKMKKIFIKEV